MVCLTITYFNKVYGVPVFLVVRDPLWHFSGFHVLKKKLIYEVLCKKM